MRSSPAWCRVRPGYKAGKVTRYTMGNLSIDAKASLQFSARRYIISVFMKDMLSLLETLAEEHDESLSKLHAALPAEYRQYVPLADYFTEEKADRLRRAVLQRGNDCARAIHDEIDKFDIQFPSVQP